MLRVHFSTKTFPNCVYEVDKVFDLSVRNEWLNTEFAKNAIKVIDNTTHVKDGYLESPFWGAMSPQKLSTGCKNILLMKFYSKPSMFYGTKCGDNCSPFILEIAKEKDLDVHFQHLMNFPSEMTAYVVEVDKMIYSATQFANEYVKFYY